MKIDLRVLSNTIAVASLSMVLNMAATRTSAYAETPAPTSAASATPAVPPTPPPPAPPTPAPMSADQASYNFGVSFGEQMQRAGLSADVIADAMARGLKDGLGGKKLSAADQQQLAQYVRSVRETAGTRNKAAAREYLANNGKQKGIQTTASGLQYRIVAPGNPKLTAPKPTDKVTVQYRGKLLDGTEFDSSYTRGQPAEFQADRVIKGWQEALTLMKPGAKWQLFIPPELAYDLNAPPGIPPGSLLIFDVELLSVQGTDEKPK